MSIASDYAARVRAASEEPEGYRCPQAYGVGFAYVTKTGDLRVDADVSPAEALKLAEWIVRTFGEEKG